MLNDRSENIDFVYPEIRQKLVTSLFLLLLLISSANSLQTFFYSYVGDKSLLSFLEIFASKLIYTLFYLLLIPIGINFIKIKGLLKTRLLWIIHLSVLPIFILVHQVITFYTDQFLAGHKLYYSFKHFLTGNTLVWLDLVVYISFVTALWLYENILKEKESSLKLAKLEARLTKLKLQELRGKIHPQFLFRILDKITSLISENRNKEANQILSLMSDFLRTTIYDNERDEIQLNEELHFLDLYINIENVTSDYKIQIDKNISHEHSQILVPNFILQPLVEEIIRSTKIKNIMLTLETSLDKINSLLQIGISINVKVDTNMWGKNNSVIIIKDRLQRLYNENHGFELLATIDGAKILLSMPMKEDYE